VIAFYVMYNGARQCIVIIMYCHTYNAQVMLTICCVFRADQMLEDVIYKLIPGLQQGNNKIFTVTSTVNSLQDRHSRDQSKSQRDLLGSICINS